MMQNVQLMSGNYRSQPEQMGQALAAMAINQYSGSYPGMVHGGGYRAPPAGYPPQVGPYNHQVGDSAIVDEYLRMS